MPTRGADTVPADVVVSYVNADMARIEPLVAALRQSGLNVWRMDPEFNAARWRAESEDHVQAAAAVIAVWSKDSARTSGIVFEDAKLADEDEKLLAVRLDDVAPPFGFRSLGTFDLLTADAANLAEVTAGLVNAIKAIKSGDQAEISSNNVEVAATSQLALLTDALVKSAGQPGSQHLVTASKSLVEALTSAATGFPAKEGEGLLQALRDQRAHEQVIEVAEVMISRGEATPKARRLYAQSLIDRGLVNAAIEYLSAAGATLPDDADEFSEVMGLLGRAYKQIYANDRRSPRSAAARKALQRALDFYADAVLGTMRKLAKPAKLPPETRPDVTTDVWNGINLIALQARAAKDGVSVPSYCDPQLAADAMTRSISDQTADPWEQATLGEAYVALGRFDKAAEHYGKFLANRSTTPFHINSALRQLREIWQLEPGSGQEGQLLAGIETRLLSAGGGSVVIDVSTVPTKSQLEPGGTAIFDAVMKESATVVVDGGHAMPETVLGSFGANSYLWHMELNRRCTAVGRVTAGRKGTVGSGFLIDGGDLAPELSGELLFLTNAHVVSNGKAEFGAERAGVPPLAEPPAKPQSVRIQFDAVSPAGPRGGYKCELLWESPMAELDVSVLRFREQAPEGIDPCPVAEAMPELRVEPANKRVRKSRVFIIGYPGGRDLAISTDDSVLQARGPKTWATPDLHHIEFMHYRTPTESGSSGSPVFDESEWSVVGVHHFGSGAGRIRSLDGTRYWRANEGVSIFSIRDAVRKAIATGEIKLRG